MIIKERENMVFRLMMFVLLFFLLSIIIVLRIIWIQTIDDHKYRLLAMKTNFRRGILSAIRGSIYSFDNIVLASTIIRYHIYLDLKVINQKLFDDNIDLLSTLLSSVLNKSKEEYKRILIKEKKKKINIICLLIILALII